MPNCRRRLPASFGPPCQRTAWSSQPRNCTKKCVGWRTGAQLSALQILHEISARTPPSITLNVDNLAITTGPTDLIGTTESYDDVVKLKNALEASPFFPTVQIMNTKT